MTDKEIKFARVIFPQKTRKEHTVPIKFVYRSKNDKDHIKPKTKDDFSENRIYRVYWPECGGKNCIQRKRCCKFYNGQIKSLGGKNFFY